MKHLVILYNFCIALHLLPPVLILLHLSIMIDKGSSQTSMWLGRDKLLVQ
jgi:hypothetical protein